MGLLRAAATLMLFAGVAVLLALVPVWGLLTGSLATAVASTGVQTALAFVAAGAVAMYLTRPAASRLLPGERTATEHDAMPRIGGWLLAFAAALVALPLWVLVRLQPFLNEWRAVLDLLGTLDIWQGAAGNGSGLVLIPLAGALTPPLLELVVMIAFALTSGVGLALILMRSRRFPRVYLLCLVLLSALVFASARGASASRLVADALRQHVRSTSPSATEVTQISGLLDRYTTAVTTPVPTLALALSGYLIWVPLLIFSSRSRRTFVREGVRRRPTAEPDIEMITRPPGRA